ncbi:MAG TPA: LysR family transcriptional regulator [Oceanobacillus sp.]|nr:LysR family transcriptional regulator [Oceanobacillus sp.]
MLDLHKLNIFVTVARLGNFTRAAEHLHMTQPTVSQQLAALEAALGAPLIERDTRRLRLTAAGEALLPYGEKMVALSNEAKEAVRTAAGLEQSTLRLGVGHTLATYVLPNLLSRYRSDYPQYRTKISVGNTSDLLALLVTDAIDLALVGSPATHPEIVTQPFMSDRLVVIVAPDDEWANRTEVEPMELLSRVFLTREPGSALHASVERLFGSDALEADNVILLGETEAIKRSVEAGLGVALVQGIAVEREVNAGLLRTLNLVGADDSRTYLVAWHVARKLPKAAEGMKVLLAT